MIFKQLIFVSLVALFTINWFYRHIFRLDLYCKKEHEKAFNRHCYAYCVVCFMNLQSLPLIVQPGFGIKAVAYVGQESCRVITSSQNIQTHIAVHVHRKIMSHLCRLT